MPLPRSATQITASSPCWLTSTRMGASAGLASRPLRTRATIDCVVCPGGSDSFPRACDTRNSMRALRSSPSCARTLRIISSSSSGRESSLDCPARAADITVAIQRAISPAFKQSLSLLINPYGDGRSGPRIAQILAETPLDSSVIRKCATCI